MGNYGKMPGIRDVIRRNIGRKRKLALYMVMGVMGGMLALAIVQTFLAPSCSIRRNDGSRGQSYPWEEQWVHQPEMQEQWPLKENHLVFLVRSHENVWPSRKQIGRVWFRPETMRGIVFVKGNERRKQESGDGFVVVHEKEREPERLRLVRMILEGFAARAPDARWFVVCEDDTVFAVENLVSLLGKYDPNEMFYVGTRSESHLQNHELEHGMAFGGAGIALSRALVKRLFPLLQGCPSRHPHIKRPDLLLKACVSELGVPLSFEPGFHQFDIRGNALGLLAAHPLTPFVSMHRMDQIEALHPNHTKLESLQRFMSAMEIDPPGFLQQTLCYNHAANLSISISSGYVVQVYTSIIYPRSLQNPQVTFRALNWGDHVGEFSMDSRPSSKSACDKPFLFYWKESRFRDNAKMIVSTYERHTHVDLEKKRSLCKPIKRFSQQHVQMIRILHTPYERDWHLTPRRQCCKLGDVQNGILTLTVKTCLQGQRIYK